MVERNHSRVFGKFRAFSIHLITFKVHFNILTVISFDCDSPHLNQNIIFISLRRIKGHP